MGAATAWGNSMTSGREIYIEKSFPRMAVLSAREGKKNQKDLKMSSVFHKLLFNGFTPAEFAIVATESFVWFVLYARCIGQLRVTAGRKINVFEH